MLKVKDDNCKVLHFSLWTILEFQYSSIIAVTPNLACCCLESSQRKTSAMQQRSILLSIKRSWLTYFTKHHRHWTETWNHCQGSTNLRSLISPQPRLGRHRCLFKEQWRHQHLSWRHRRWRRQSQQHLENGSLRKLATTLVTNILISAKKVTRLRDFRELTEFDLKKNE